MSQELACKRDGEAETYHPVSEGATRDSAGLHCSDALSQVLLMHRNLPCRLDTIAGNFTIDPTAYTINRVDTAVSRPVFPDRYIKHQWRHGCQ
jgi:hypothetical protein